ncbi:MAG: hypothetical protein N4A54_07735 [Peptostreptococcaceae bacterium]|jgi:hypothetical protein|nr:hypothetical protein [Peptostreptococcaceae bacterium]
MQIENKNMPQYLYRFMDFTNLIDMFEQKQLVLVNPRLWDDPYENRILKYLEYKETLREIINYLKTIVDKELYISNFINAAIYSKYISYQQSWTELEESDAMWRIYNTNKNYSSIKVKIDRLYLQNLLAKNSSNDSVLSYNKVQYYKNFNLNHQLKNIIQKGEFTKINFDIQEIFFNKRYEFNHEKEWRIYCIDLTHYNNTIESTRKETKDMNIDSEEYLDFFINLNEKYKKKKSPIFKLSINPIEFIESVTIHPLAPPHIAQTIRAYIDNFNNREENRDKRNIEFEVSKLYKFE